MLLFRWLSPHHFVLLACFWLSFACVLAYGISVGLGKVGAFFPYISTAGATPPASCVFGLSLNVAGVFAFISLYIRHGDIERSFLLDHYRIQMINDIAMFIGSLACFGMFLVGCFQSTVLLSVHMFGAGMLFICGIIYCYLQSYLSYINIGGSSTNLKTIIRFVIAMIATLALIFTIVFGYISTSRSHLSMKEKLHWNTDEPGYYSHLVSAFSEWIMASCLFAFVLTFYHEFKNMESKFEVKRKLDLDMIVSSC